MARIDWQPLAIPDIGESALRAQQMAGDSIRSAFQDFSGVLGQWEGQRREENLTELYRRQNRFTAGTIGPDGRPTGVPDVAGYAADLADGDLMGDLSYLKAADLAAARGFTGELRTGRAAEETRNRNILVQGREDATHDRGELERTVGQSIARTLLPLRQEAERTGDLSSYRTAMAAILEANPGATAAQIEGMLDGGQEAVRGFREGRNSDQSFRSTQYTFDRTLRTDRQNDRASVILNEITRDNIDGVSALSTLNANYGNEDAEVLNAIRAQIPNAFATLDSVTGAEVGPAGEGESSGGFAAAGGTFAGTATDAMGVLNYNAREGGFGAVPANIRTYDDLDRFGSRMLGVRGVTSSASGPFQITRDTRREFGERALGANWRSLPPTIENDDKIARAIFEAAKARGPGAISDRWSAIDTGEARRLMTMPWEQARLMIARQEGGVVPDATPAGSVRTSRANLQAGLSVGTDGGFSGNRTAQATGYLAASQRPGVTAQAIANELVGEGGSYAGSAQNRIRADVEKLMNDTGVSAAVAGWALDQTRRNRGFAERAISLAGATGAVAPNLPEAKNLIMSTRTPEMRDNVSLVQNNVEVQGALDRAEAANTAARQRLATAEARVQANGGRGDVSRYMAEVQSTATLLAQAQTVAEEASIARPVGERPPRATGPIPGLERSYLNGPSAPIRRSIYQGGGSTDRR